METNTKEISITNKKSILEFIDSHYDIYHHKQDPETLIQPLLNQIEITLNSKQLPLNEKGNMLFFKSALSMMLDKGSSQLEKDLLKAVGLKR
jgi:hypothetical protein